MNGLGRVWRKLSIAGSLCWLCLAPCAFGQRPDVERSEVARRPALKRTSSRAATRRGQAPSYYVQQPDAEDDGQADGPGQVGPELTEQPATRAQAPPAPQTSLLSQLGGGSLSPEVSSGAVSGAGRQITAQAPSANIVSGAEASTRATTDVGNLLRESQRTVGVYVVQRSPIIGDPRIRGYRFGQYLAAADGGFWFPARLDVDSIISKIDSRIVEDVVVVSGPYTSRYGPAFSFIDVATTPPPRHECCPRSEAITGLNYNINGAQWYARQTVTGGGADYGYVAHYSHLTGSDYESGNGTTVPSSYKSRNFNAALGYDLSPDASVTFRYLRQDQTDVELAGQFTDIDFLASEAFNVNYTAEDRPYFDLFTLDAWYNRTRGQGSSQRSSKQELLRRVLTGGTLGFTDYDVASTGYTAAMTWGETDHTQLTLGSDLRYHQRSLNETQVRIGPLFQPVFMRTFPGFTAETLIPDSHSSNPGLFAEYVRPVNCRLRIKAGARVDWVSTDAAAGSTLRRLPFGDRPLDVLGPDRDRNFALWSTYLTAEYEIDDVWTLDLGGGFAERPPTLEELYAQRSFESVLQQGLNRIQGFPLLNPSRLRQIDVGLKAEYADFRGGVRGFHAWIEQYITSQTIAIDPTSSLDRVTTVFVNTDLATLAGVELQGEYDVDCRLTAFGSMSYVEGRNHTLNSFLFTDETAPPGSSQGGFALRDMVFQGTGEEPLPQIPPLESRLGVRLHPPGRDPKWALEFMARIVDNQDRVASATLLEAATPGFTTYDIRGIWRPSENATLIAGVLNLTDKQYREHLDSRAGDQLFQPGVTGYFGGQVEF